MPLAFYNLSVVIYSGGTAFIIWKPLGLLFPCIKLHLVPLLPLASPLPDFIVMRISRVHARTLTATWVSIRVRGAISSMFALSVCYPVRFWNRIHAILRSVRLVQLHLGPQTDYYLVLVYPPCLLLLLTVVLIMTVSFLPVLALISPHITL